MRESGKMKLTLKLSMEIFIVLLILIPASAALTARMGSLLMKILVSLAAILLGCVLVFFLMKRALQPLEEMESMARELASGRFDRILPVKSQDEIGALSAALNAMSSNLKQIIADTERLLQEMAVGNFAAQSSCPEQYVGDFALLLQSIRGMDSKLFQTLSSINTAAEQVGGGAGQVSAGAQALSQGTMEQAASVEELSATMDDISAKFRNNDERRNSARKLFKESAEGFTVCNQKMEQLLAAMNDISARTDGIGKIIGTIDGLAFQTNILALNAAVEAARAGEAGRGFSVVADEVRSLAQKSAEAAKNTNLLIKGAVAAVQAGSKLTGETAEALRYINENSDKVAAITNEIGKDAQAQTDGVERVSIGLSQISTVVQTNSATAEESAAASEELSRQARVLKEYVSQFHLEKA